MHAYHIPRLVRSVAQPLEPLPNVVPPIVAMAVNTEDVLDTAPIEESTADETVAGDGATSPVDEDYLECVFETIHSKIGTAISKNPNTVCQECGLQTGSGKAL